MPYIDNKNECFWRWKSYGVVGDLEDIYNKWNNSTSCEKCSHDYSYYKKCMDHCHVSGEFRNILCDACNSNDKVNNTSGYPNIIKNKGGWTYEKNIKKVRHRKWFKTKEEAIAYKLEFESA